MKLTDRAAMNVIAVDVGTASVRLAIISFQGERAQEATVLGSCKRDIGHHQDGCRFEQSSSEIWNAICQCSQECIGELKVQAETIRGIAFSATCSLVIQEFEGAKSHVNDTIMWLDHRSIEVAERISASDSKVLSQFGGNCSPEFTLAKLSWLKENDLGRLEKAIGFFELPDWLVYRCVGGKPASCARSLCCVTCKWGYDAEQRAHCDIIRSLDSRVGGKIGNSVLAPGTVAGLLSREAAAELGLFDRSSSIRNKENFKPLEVLVGTSLIDAHAGTLAMLSVPLKEYAIKHGIESTFCSLAGTSSCHMILSEEKQFRRGIWGPYKDVLLQGYYLLEAGQSLTGKLIEICIESHAEGKSRLRRGEKMYNIIRSLNEKVIKSNLEIDLHILPTFHGNRSPIANPRLRGGIYGLSAEGTKGLLEHYVATVESIVYETKLIVETLGVRLDTMLVSGGLMKNTLYMQILADVLNCRVVKMSVKGVDFMVLGSGLVARHAVLSRTDQSNQGQPLNKRSIEDIEYKQLDIELYWPRKDRSAYHEKRYLCFKKFLEFSQSVDEIMHTSDSTRMDADVDNSFSKSNG